MNFDFVFGLVLIVVAWIAFVVALGFVARTAIDLFCLGFGC